MNKITLAAPVRAVAFQGRSERSPAASRISATRAALRHGPMKIRN